MEDFPLAFNPCLSGIGKSSRDDRPQPKGVEEGTFKMVLTRLRDDAVIIDVDESNIDMWRGVSEEDFIRPKWGIYRSTAEIEKLRADEEQVRFADFVVRKGTPD